MSKHDETTELRSFTDELHKQLMRHGLVLSDSDFSKAQLAKALRQTIISATDPIIEQGYRTPDNTIISEPSLHQHDFMPPERSVSVQRRLRRFSVTLVTQDWRRND